MEQCEGCGARLQPACTGLQTADIALNRKHSQPIQTAASARHILETWNSVALLTHLTACKHRSSITLELSPLTWQTLYWLTLGKQVQISIVSNSDHIPQIKINAKQRVGITQTRWYTNHKLKLSVSIKVVDMDQVHNGTSLWHVCRHISFTAPFHGKNFCPDTFTDTVPALGKA